MDNFDKAIKAAKDLSGYEGNDHRIINHHSDYLNGALYVVEFNANDGTNKTNYVYIEGNDIQVCKNPALLNEFVSRKSQKSAAVTFIETIGGTSGIIGLIITVTIVGLLINNPKADIPQILSAALTTILGFYFGSKTNK